jgi:hypothetical protein
MSKAETLLGQKQAETERILLEKDTEFNFKMKLMREELELKERMLMEKTQEIYALIAHIQRTP